MTNKPTGTFHNALTNETLVRELTDDEYADLLAEGWTPGEEATEE